MSTESLARFWSLIYSAVREFWAITEPHIENAAVRNDVPIELYYYSELGLKFFSVGEFQKRDPFTNPEQFEKAFARFDVKGWIFPLPDERYQVSRNAQDAVRRIIHAGDERLAEFGLMPDLELEQLVKLLKQIRAASLEAPEPPEKWAVIHRFRASDDASPPIVQIRELLMDLFAYRDDSHLAAARPHFGQAGIVWDVLGSIASGSAVNAGQMAERLALRGYEEQDYEVAIQAALEIGWVEAGEMPDTFRPTPKGREIREQVERQTDEYFFRPWSILAEDELDGLHSLLSNLRGQLTAFRKTQPGDKSL